MPLRQAGVQKTAGTKSLPFRSHVSSHLERSELVGAENDVISDGDAQQTPGGDEFLGEYQILGRRRGIARRMIVEDDYRDRVLIERVP